MLEILVGPGAELRKKIIAKGIISRRIHVRKLPKTRRFVGLACRGRVRAWCGWCVGFVRSWAERVRAIPTHTRARTTPARVAFNTTRRARARALRTPGRARRTGRRRLSLEHKTVLYCPLPNKGGGKACFSRVRFRKKQRYTSQREPRWHIQKPFTLAGGYLRWRATMV